MATIGAGKFAESICPVIFISARIGEMDQVMALENGGDDYITKPFMPKLSWQKFVANSGGPMVNMRQRTEERVLEIEDSSYIPERMEMTFRSKT